MIMNLVSFTINNLIQFYFISKILDKKLDIRCFFISILNSFLLELILLQFHQISVFPIFLGIIWLEAKFLWKQPTQVTGIAVMLSYFTMILCEVILTLFVLLWVPRIFVSSPIWIFGFQITLYLFTLLLFETLSFTTLYQKILRDWGYQKISLGVLFLTISIIEFQLYQQQQVMFNLLFIVIVSLLIIEFVIERIKKEKLMNEYESLLHMTEKFENVLNEKNKLNQEYRNQLIVLKQMIQSSPDAEAYIEQMFQESFSENLNLYFLREVEKITSNKALKGLFYYKINSLFRQDVKVTLDVDSKVKKMCDFIQNENFKCLTQALGCMFDYSKFLLKESNIKQMSITMYTNQKHLYIAFTHSIGKNNLPFTKENDSIFFLKDLLKHHLHFKRNETILDGIYTQTLEIRI